MLTFLNSWVVMTLVLFHFGPVDWPHAGSALVTIVVLAALGGFNMGVQIGRRTPALPEHEVPLLTQSAARWWIAGAFMIFSAFHTYNVTGLLIFDPFAYSFDFNAVYISYQQTLQDRGTGLLENVILLTKAVIMPMVILMIVTSFRRETPLFLFLLFPFVASSMMRGTDKETVDLVLYFLVLAYFHGLMGRRFLIAMLLIGGVLVLFAARKMARFEEVDLHCLPGSPYACFDFQNWLSTYISPGFEFMRIMMTNYLTQGYEGLARALNIPFEFNWGLGHMQPVKNKFCDTLDVLCQTKTFNDNLPNYGWDTTRQWSSAYTAIASDFHWVFIPVYMFFIGIIFGASEKSWWINQDKISLTCLLLIVLFFIYASANMQLTVSFEWSIVYLSLFIWQFCRMFVHSQSLRLRTTA